MIGIARQPRSVQAIAFACVVSYMGIGLVDPILPTIAASLNATPGQTELLFTTYLFTTATVMFFSSWVSSHLGMRRTLLLGLGLVVTFAAACALSGHVGQVIGFRGGWGVGNALFVSTALAAIIGSADRTREAIVLYEAALGVGMALGPLAGGLLGEVSWRGPFAGTAILMGLGLLGIGLYLKQDPPGRAARDFWAPFRALRRRDFLPILAAAFFYNYGYFTILAFTPFPLHEAAALQGWNFTPIHLGLVFFGWGILLALSSVVLAPLASRRFGLTTTLLVSVGALAVVEVIFYAFISTLAVVMAATLASGVLLGLVNTVMTEAGMEATDLPRAVASSSYSGVRFFGAALAPTFTGPLSAAGGIGMPYLVGAGALAVACVALALHGRSGRPHETHAGEAAIVGVGGEA